VVHRYTFELERRWNRGELQVRLERPGMTRPLGYCDGTPEDEEALQAIGREEGLDEDMPISKRILKTGRQVWTIGTMPVFDEEDDD